MANSEDKDPALDLGISFSNDSDREAAQLPLNSTASAIHASRQTTPPANVQDDLALALGSSQICDDDFFELPSQESAPAGDEANLTTPPSGSNEDYIEPARSLSQSQPPADVFNGQAVVLNQRREGRTAIEEGVTSFSQATSISEAIILVEQGTEALERYNISGMLDELEEGINALRNANGFIPEDHPMKVTCLNNLRYSFQSRFDLLGDIADLDEVITAQQQTVRLIPDGDPLRHMYFSSIGISFHRRFERLGHIADLNKAIMATQQAVHLTPDGHPYKPMYLNSLGILFENRRSDIADLNEAIAAKQQAVHLTPDHHTSAPKYLNSLGISLQSRFERLGDVGDLNEAITAKQEAVGLTPAGHPAEPRHLDNLGISFQSRFECLGDIADLDEAITAHRKAVHLTADNPSDLPPILTNLGNAFLRRFERLGDSADLKQAITVQQQAVCLTTDRHPDRPMHLNSLGLSLRHRFERLGGIADIVEAISDQQEAVRLAPEAHPDMPMYLGNLGTSLLCRFKRLGDRTDLDEAITVHQKAVRLAPEGHPKRPMHFSSLGTSFQYRFELLGDIADLNEAITAKQQAIHLTPHGHPHRPMHLNNLGTSLHRRFERLGDIVDLDEAITAQQQAVRLAPDGHLHMPTYLNNLGNSLYSRYERLGDNADLNEAIKAQQQAVRLTAEDHPAKPWHLNSLGNSFLHHLGRLDGIITIMVQQEAVRLTPYGHPDRPMYLRSLGISFRRRFERLGDIADLEEAITDQQEAVRLTPDGHHGRPMCLASLGTSFHCRFERLRNIADLDETIITQQQAIDLTPHDHPDRPAYLYDLGISFQSRFKYQSDDATFAQAIDAYSQSAKASSGPPSIRFKAACVWAELCFSIHSNESLEAYSILFGLLPRVVWLGRTVEQRYNEISGVGDAVTDAAAAAIHFGKYDLALEWLEQGRSVVWGQILQLRTPLDELRQHHPKEANKLKDISRDLDSAGVTHHLALPSNDTPRPLEEVAHAHRRLAREYDHALARIRNLPGFSGFLQPQKSASLCSAAISGPVVIVNACKSRCDALVVLPHSSQVSHVPLPTLQMSIVQKMRIQLAGVTRGENTPSRHFSLHYKVGTSLSDVLRQLWLLVVEPILSYLNLPMCEKLPHITWCLTGPLTFLPIHAAGLYDSNDAPKIFKYAVSSYTPTLSSLLAAKHRLPRRNQTGRLLAVSQPATPGLDPLPGTVAELNAIQTFQSPMGQLHITRLEGAEATIATVLRHMKECNWIHLACHGVQDAANPTESAFHLIDKPLTLKEIMKQSFTHTELAVLSACQTAKGNSELPEEAIHLAAGMLMAGYGSVVATMWSIRDNDAPIIAEKFYKYLIEEACGDSSRATYALHNAVAHLRDVRGENNFGSWVPFIHLGMCSPLLE